MSIHSTATVEGALVCAAKQRAEVKAKEDVVTSRDTSHVVAIAATQSTDLCAAATAISVEAPTDTDTEQAKQRLEEPQEAEADSSADNADDDDLWKQSRAAALAKLRRAAPCLLLQPHRADTPRKLSPERQSSASKLAENRLMNQAVTGIAHAKNREDMNARCDASRERTEDPR